tara:strand:- start:6157 stop:6951 length:795 start_codon:yes stop_codon:yes gene_type:complete
MDVIEQMKEQSKAGWASFIPFENATGIAAAQLVSFARVSEGSHLLDVACGTGVVALTAAHHGVTAEGVDLTPELVERARENAQIARLNVKFTEGDVEALPFQDASFDFVLSQFGHMFGPRAALTTKELLRVLKPKGVIAFSTWPPDFFTGNLFQLLGKYSPPPPEGITSPVSWGKPDFIREQLGNSVKDLVFDSGQMRLPGLSPVHIRIFAERNIGPVKKLIGTLEPSPEKLQTFRAELESLILRYFEDNSMRQDFLMTRAIKL